VPFWHVDDLEARSACLVAAGATVVQAVSEVGGGRRTTVIADADGNQFGLMQD
jgi:predicted enzyme related to lactoylglutathione lyase